MADIASELPIRTQLPGQVNYDDVIVKLGDATTPSQQASVDTHGSVQSKIADASGNVIASQLISASYWLQVTAPNIGPAAAGTAATFSALAGAVFNSATGLGSPLTAGQQAALQVDANGRLLVTGSNFPVTVDTNWGVVGASTIRVAAELGNATGSADFNFGAASAQTLRSAALIGNATGAADFNTGAIGAQTLRVAAQLANATGAVDFNFGAASAQTIRVAAVLGNATGALDYNYGTVDNQTVRVASQIGNSTGAADYNNGVTGAQTLRTAANLAVGGANVSSTNPVPVAFSSAPLGTAVNNYNTVAAVAAAASSNHTYTITAGKTFQGKKIWGSASGLMKIEVQISPDGSTFTSVWVGFNSTANPNIAIDLDEMVFIESGTSAAIRVIRTNLDKKSQDVYSTISGTEI